MPIADLTDEKQALRVAAADARRRAHAVDADAAARAVRDNFLAHLVLAPATAVGGYWPIGTELDVRPLLTALHERGHVCALPAVHKRQPLVFHRWRPEDKLVRGVFDIEVPDRHTPIVDPDVLLVPLLAFDARGMRIGYGGGYIDRTLAALRGRKTVLAVGLAFAAQEVARVPSDAFDQPLDWIVTEKGTRFFDRRRFPWLRRFWTS